MTRRALLLKSVAFAGLILCLLACTLPSTAVSPPGPDAKPDAALLKAQTLVLDMADDYIAALGESVYLLTRGEKPDAKGRWLAMSFLRNGVGASLDIAIGPNPSTSLLDLLVLVSLQTWSFEKHWIPNGIGDAGTLALARLKRAEADAWASARVALSEEQIAALHVLIENWIRENPDRTVVALVRFDEFDDARRISSAAMRGKAEGLLKQVSEVTAEVEDVRLFGERLLWFAGRYPYLLGEQTELTAYRIFDQPEMRQLFAAGKSAQHLSDTLAARVETLDATLEQQQNQLFARLHEERMAMVNHFFDSFAKERSRFLDDITSRQSELSGIMKELRETVAASERLAVETTSAATAVDRVVARIASDTGKNFRITDVRDAALETAAAAERLTRLLERTEQLLASESLNRAVDNLSQPADRSIDRLFWRGVILILLLIGGLALLRLIPQRNSGK